MAEAIELKEGTPIPTPEPEIKPTPRADLRARLRRLQDQLVADLARSERLDSGFLSLLGDVAAALRALDADAH